jgi:hypothetical protein
VSTQLVYKSIQRSIFREVMSYVVGALIVKGFNFMRWGKKYRFFFMISWTVPNDRFVSWVNLRMDGVSAIVCLTSSIFSAVLFVGRPLPFCAEHYLHISEKHVFAFVDFLGKLLVKCLESPESFVENFSKTRSVE